MRDHLSSRLWGSDISMSRNRMSAIPILYELLSPLQRWGHTNMLRMIFLVMYFWCSLSSGRRWRNISLDGERSAAFHTFVEPVCAIDAHISMTAREDDGVVIFRVKLLEAYHAMK